MLVAVQFGASAAMAKAGEWTGNDLIRFCTSDKPNAKAKDRDEEDRVTYCAGYWEATVTSIYMFDGRWACVPPKTTPADLLFATVEWLRRHPDQKQYLAASDAFAAVHAKWPCP